LFFWTKHELTYCISLIFKFQLVYFKKLGPDKVNKKRQTPATTTKKTETHN